MGSPQEFDKRAAAFFDGLHMSSGPISEKRDRAFDEPTSRALVDDTGGPRLDALRSSAREHVKARRLSAESDGVLVEGVVYDTSEGGLLRLIILLVFANRDPDYTASVQVRNGTVRRMTAPELYKVASAVANHMQSCALWEKDALLALNNAVETEDFAAAEATVFDAIPTGDVTTPAAPDGTPAPPDFAGSRFEDVTCLSANVNGDLAVTNNANLGGDLRVDGPVTCGSSANVAGKVTAGSIACTGPMLAGATTVTSLDSGSGVVKTTGQILAASATITGALVAGICTLAALTCTSATVSGAVSAGSIACSGTLSSNAATVASLNAGTGLIKTTGSVSAGSATITGALVAGLCTLTTLNVGTVTATGRVAAGTIACTGSLTSGAATVASVDAGSGQMKTTGGVLSGTSTTTGLLTAGTVTTPTLNVTQDAVIERLYARDQLSVGTFWLDRRAISGGFTRVGSFWWRRGDRRPARAFVAFETSSNKATPNILFWDPAARTQFGGYDGGADPTTATFVLTTPNTVPNSNDFYEVEVYLGNTGKGSVTITAYNVTLD